MNPAASERLRKERKPEAFCSDPRCLWRASSGPCPKHSKPMPKCPACLNPILPGDMTEPCFTLEHGEQRVHWDCAHGNENTEADATDYSEYNADKGVRGVR